MYSFEIIDPHFHIVATPTLGIEVTDHRAVALCDLGNIDPQHGYLVMPGGDGAYADAVVSRSACEAAQVWPLPPKGANLVTSRPDLDSVAAMAVLSLRATGVDMDTSGRVVAYRDGLAERLFALAEADNFAMAGEWRPRPLPTPDAPWGDGAVEDRRDLAAANAVAQNRDLSLTVRVAVVAAWLLGGEEPSDIDCDLALRATCVQQPAEGAGEMVRTILRTARERVETARHHLIRALSPQPMVPYPMDSVDRSIAACGHRHPPTMTVVDRDGIAVVHGSHPGALGVGYCVAPVVVALNPAFRWPDGSTGKKATVAFYRSPGVETMKRLAERLTHEDAAEIADSVDLTATYASYYPGCFVQPKGDNFDTVSAAIRRGDIETARGIALAAHAEGVNEAWFEAMRARILNMLAGRGGWGGNFASGILGSPQGHDTMLSSERIAAIVREVTS